MIVVDTSALMAITLKKSDADGCVAAIRDEGDILISTGTLAEAWVVAGRRDLGAEMKTLVAGIGATVAPLTQDSASSIAAANDQCSKGVPRLA